LAGNVWHVRFLGRGVGSGHLSDRLPTPEVIPKESDLADLSVLLSWSGDHPDETDEG